MDEPTINDEFARTVESFLATVSGIRQTSGLIMALLYQRALTTNCAMLNFYQERFGTLLAKADAETEALETDSPKQIQLGPAEAQLLMSLARDHESAKIALRIVPASLLISLVAQFDAYFGRIVQVVFRAQPGLLNASGRTIKLSDLLTYPSMEEAKQTEIDKEVELLLRESHDKMFEWLENRLSLKIKEKISDWPRFVELTERRNLFVHTDGKVSRQYLDRCREQNVALANTPVTGESLEVAPDYLIAATECVQLVAVKLAYLLWRKLVPKEANKTDLYFNSVAYGLIRHRQYHTALSILEFVTTTAKPQSSQETQLMIHVNAAQSHKWKNEPEKCEAILSRTDWSALSVKFRLACSVLRDDFRSAAELMKRAVQSGEIEKEDLKQWPLFQRFRETHEFKSTFLEVYGEEYRLEMSQPVPSWKSMMDRILETQEQVASLQSETDDASRTSLLSAPESSECAESEPSSR